MLLVLRQEDIRWLTGFSGKTSQLLVDRIKKCGYLFVDGRYVERAEADVRQHAGTVEIVSVGISRKVDDLMLSLANGRGIEVDPSHLTVARMDALREKFIVHCRGSELDDLRRVKDVEELSYIELAASIADDALQYVVADGLMGWSERHIRNQIDFHMKRLGAHDVAFETIVATGPNAARPHHEPTDDVVENGHMVIIDMGACIEGYRSDMTRTISVGSVSRELRSLFETVIESQASGIDAVRAGATGANVDAACRSVFERAGLAHEYLHSTGHGIGLYVHETPIMGPTCTAILAAGEVVTVEPGLYRKGVGGVRIEDLVVVTDTSCRIITQTPKDLTCPRSLRTI